MKRKKKLWCGWCKKVINFKVKYGVILLVRVRGWLENFKIRYIYWVGFEYIRYIDKIYFLK